MAWLLLLGVRLTTPQQRRDLKMFSGPIKSDVIMYVYIYLYVYFE